MEPPVEDKGKEYTVLVPHVDADGNEVPGIRGPDLEVPLSNLYRLELQAAREPLRRRWPQSTAAIFPSPGPVRRDWKKVIPAPSIEERYGSRARYVKLVALASQRLVEQRLILEEDADRFVEQAMSEPAFDEIG